MTGLVVLLQRGTCDFGLKAEIAEAEGAAAVVLFNEGTIGAADRNDVLIPTLAGSNATEFLQVVADNVRDPRPGPCRTPGRVEGLCSDAFTLPLPGEWLRFAERFSPRPVLSKQRHEENGPPGREAARFGDLPRRTRGPSAGFRIYGVPLANRWSVPGSNRRPPACKAKWG